MSKKANPTAIGAFVIAGLALVTIAALTLGSGKFFKSTQAYVLYFDASLGGLDVGAPVEFGGVPIGSVSAIRLVYNLSDDSIRIPVYINLEPDRLCYTGASEEKRDIEHLIEHGLRAQLHTQSLLTGKLKIMLVDAPNSPINLVGDDDTVPEIPTMPTATAELTRKLSDLPFAEVAENVHVITAEVMSLLGGESFSNILSSASATMASLEETFDTLQSTLPATMDQLNKTLSALDTVVTEFTPIIKEMNHYLPEARDGLKKSNTTLQKTLASIDNTLNEVKGLLAAESPVRYETKHALSEIASAAGSVRFLLEYLQMHPESLITGKKNGEK